MASISASECSTCSSCEPRPSAATLRSIGPVWDGNEVWLLAGGGTLYFAFPLLYASAFSGFYLPLMIVLWLLILRGVSLELRNHIDVGVWRDLLDGVFGLSSGLLTIFFGAALANVLRGVPLQADGYFFLPLWTNWAPGVHPGILDWYTVIGGVLALAALTLHGALWLVMKVSGDLEQRARQIVPVLCAIVSVLTLVSLWATMAVRSSSLNNYFDYPVHVRHSSRRRCVPRSHLVLQSRRPTHQSIPRIMPLSILHARGSMLGTLSHPPARHHRPGPRHHPGKSSLRPAHACRGSGLVGSWHGAAVGYVVFVYSRFKGKVNLESSGH
jgi:cytochrome d ubiquinol oxidase subunit II